MERIITAGYEYFVRKEWKKLNREPCIVLVGEQKLMEHMDYPRIGRNGRLG